MSLNVIHMDIERLSWTAREKTLCAFASLPHLLRKKWGLASSLRGACPHFFPNA